MLITRRKDLLFTLDNLLEFLKSRPDEERWELLDGRIVMMNPAAGPHQAIVKNLTVMFDSESDRTGTAWFVYPGLGVREPGIETWGPIPDVVVTSEPPPLIKDGYCVEPIVIVEVLSPSTKRLDRIEKRRFYKKIASLRHYAIVHQDRMRLELLTRAKDWTERVFEQPDDEVSFAALGLIVLLHSIYRRTGIE